MVVGIITAIFGVLMALQSPQVQSHIIRKMVSQLENGIDGKVSFDKISIRPFNAISIENLSITDNAPFISPKDSLFERVDTLFRAKAITVTFGVGGLFRKEGLHTRRIELDDALFALTNEPLTDSTSTTNLKRIFRIVQKKREPKDNAIFDAKTVCLQRVRFKLLNYKKLAHSKGKEIATGLSGPRNDSPSAQPSSPSAERQSPMQVSEQLSSFQGAERRSASQVAEGPSSFQGAERRSASQAAEGPSSFQGAERRGNLPQRAINWFDLDVMVSHIHARNLRMKGRVMQGELDEMSLSEKSGYIIRHISGKAKAGGGQTLVTDLKIKDNGSILNIPRVLLSYKDNRSWADFVNAVTLDVQVERSHAQLQSVAYYSQGLLGKRLSADLSFHFHGTISDFTVSEVAFNATDSGVCGKLRTRISGLPDAQKMFIDGQLSDLRFTTRQAEDFIKGWAPQSRIRIAHFAKGHTLHLPCKVRGTLNSLKVSGEASSDIGEFQADILLKNLINRGDISIGGTLATHELDLGEIFSSKSLGKCSLSTGVNTTLTGKNRRLCLDSLSVSRLDLLGYSYRNIAASGIYEDNAFNGRVICSDPNLNFLFQGILTPSVKTRNALYQFYANIGYADLHALHVSGKPVAKISLSTTANFKRIAGADVIGNIDVRDLILEDEDGQRDIGGISISSHVSDDVNRVRLSSSFAEGSYVGSGFFGDFLSDLKALTLGSKLPATLQKDAALWSGNKYNVSFRLHDTRPVLPFFLNGLYIADSTALSLGIDEKGRLRTSLKSNRIALKDKYLKNVKLSIDNAAGSPTDNLSLSLTSSECSISPVLIKNNRLTAYARENRVASSFTYDNLTQPLNRGELYSMMNFERSESDSLILRAEVMPSTIFFNSGRWNIGHSGITVSGQRTTIDGLTINNDAQTVRIHGGVSGSLKDSISVDLDSFNIALANAFIRPQIDLQGLASGYVSVTSPLSVRPGVMADIHIDSTKVASEPVGRLSLKSNWEEEALLIHCHNDIEGRQTLLSDCIFSPSSKSLEGYAKLSGLSIAYAQPLLSTLFSQMSGSLSGNIRIGGSPSQLALSSDDLKLENGFLALDFTKVGYNVSGTAALSPEGVFFGNIALKDRLGASGRLTGGIKWNYLKDMKLDTRAEFERMEVLNLAEGENPSFYGNVFATGSVSIKGPANAVSLTANASTQKNGEFHIPLKTQTSAQKLGLLTFKEMTAPVKVDPYEEMVAKIQKKKKVQGDLQVKLYVDVDAGTEAFVEVDKSTGNVMNGRGAGRIDVEVRPSRGLFSLGGQYDITSGRYHFVQRVPPIVVKRDFVIQDGSSIKFNGNVNDSELSINALYKTKASIGKLINDTTSTVRRNVECAIAVSDKLSSPRVDLSVHVPDLDPVTSAQVDNALSTNDKVQKQFLSLLVSNSFMPDEQGGVVNNPGMLNNTLAEIMGRQLSSLLQKFNIPVDLGIDYQTNGPTDVFDVALSTELFDSRVIVNGTIGNRQYSVGDPRTDGVAGDLDIEVKLDKPGAFRLNLFSHSADGYTSYLDNSQRNGIGVAYQKEFNSFREFLRNLFKGKKKRLAAEQAEQRARLAGEKKVIRISEIATEAPPPRNDEKDTDHDIR